MSKFDNFSSKNATGRISENRQQEYRKEDRNSQTSTVVYLPENADMNDLERALKRLKNAMQKSGITAELRERETYKKPSEHRREKDRKRKKAIIKYKQKEAKRDGR